MHKMQILVELRPPVLLMRTAHATARHRNQFKMMAGHAPIVQYSCVKMPLFGLEQALC
jgi:hypothetical protein